MTVPYTFGTATTSIPLSNLDANFNTPITLGNTSIYLGNTTTTIGNLTLTNATISSGTVNITNVTVTTANVTNITVTGTANIATGNITTLTSTSITDSGLTSGRVTYAGASGLLTDSATLTYDGTTLTATTGANFVTTSGNVNIGTTVNNVFDQVGGARPLLVQKSDTSTTIGGSTASITISNGATTTSNTAQLNFAAITGASTSQYSSAVISAIFGARTNGQYPTGELAFLTSSTLNAAPSEKMRITSAGDVGLGVTGTIGGNTWKFGSVFTSLGLGLACTNSSGNMANFYTSTSTFAGAITVSAAVTLYTSASDYRLKENIVPMTGALAKLALLKPVTYTWKNNGDKGEGFIAHELQEIVPNAVVGEKDELNKDGSIKPQSIDTSSLIATLTSAIQEQQALIESLTTRLTALENK